jgi:hypothetical protein
VRIVAGGFVPGCIADPTQPGLIYARTDIGSVYRWNQSNRQWIPLTDFQSPANYNLNGPESVALDPTDPTRLYIAAGMYNCAGCPFGILISTDQGASFTTATVPFLMASNNDGRTAGERLAVNPFSPNELFMGTRYNGLFKSEGHAQTWAKVTSFPISVSSDGFGVQWVVFDPANSATIYAGVYTSSTIYKSIDDGATWAALPGQPLSWPFSVSSGAHAPVPMRAVVNPDGNLWRDGVFSCECQSACGERQLQRIRLRHSSGQLLGEREHLAAARQQRTATLGGRRRHLDESVERVVGQFRSSRSGGQQHAQFGDLPIRNDVAIRADGDLPV